MRWRGSAAASGFKLKVMLYSLSLSDNHTGKWIGGVIVNGSSEEHAIRCAMRRLDQLDGRCVEVFAIPVPVGAVIPPGFYGRLLNLAEVAALSPCGKVTHLSVSDDGEIVREEPDCDAKALAKSAETVDTFPRPN